MSPDRNLLLATALLAITAMVGYRANSDDCPTDNPSRMIQAGALSLQVELAANEQARRCGLAFRDVLPLGQGMLFIFPRNARWPFWMKDTRIPLTLLFIDEHQTVVEIFQLTPDMHTRRTYPRRAVRYALEMHPEDFKHAAIKPGTRIHLGDLRSTEPVLHP